MIKYSLAYNSWNQREINAINRVISSDQYTMGSSVKHFENYLAQHHGVKHCIMTNSGSSANLVASYAISFKRFGEKLLSPDKGSVIVPAVSWSTTYFPLMQLGYNLVFVDVDRTFNIDVDQIKKSISNDTVGICGVNLLGVSADNHEIRKICDEHELFFIEDNCESFGAQQGSRMCGTFGDAGTLSFFFSHHLQTMEGGAILTNCDDIARFSRSLRAHGWTRDGDYPDLINPKYNTEFEKNFQFILPGFCVRPLEFSGEIGIEQLKKWPEQKKQRIINHNHFIDNTKIRNYFTVQSSRGEPTWFGFGVLFNSHLSFTRDQIFTHLKDKEIDSRPIVAGNFTKQPAIKFAKYSTSELPMSNKIDSDGLFFGNDGRDLRKQIDQLFKILDELLT